MAKKSQINFCAAAVLFMLGGLNLLFNPITSQASGPVCEGNPPSDGCTCCPDGGIWMCGAN